MHYPILLISPKSNAQQVAELLERLLVVSTEVTPSRRPGMAALRRHEYTLVLLDEELAATDDDAANGFYEKAHATPVLELNFSPGLEQRIVRQVRAAMVRRAHDQAVALRDATTTLQNDLKGSLSGLLLESQLALRAASPASAAKLRHLVQLADDLRARLSV
jgi:hypothetical protein